MYRVLCDGLPIFDLRDESLVLLDASAALEVNTPGSFEFKMPPVHPQYDLPQRMRSCVEIWHDDEQIFAGRPTSDKTDFYNRKLFKCEGQLAYLNDSIQRPHEFHDMTVRGYLEYLIEVHNSQVDESRRFEVGIVTVIDKNDSLFRYTNYNSTWKEIKEDLIDDLGGYIRVRNHNGHRYIDYIAEFDNLCNQTIQFGENLLDCSRNVDLTDIATAVIPLGARLEESDIAALEKRLTIESVNNGLDYIVNAEAVAKYGFIVKTVIWDDVTTPEALKRKGERWLTDEQFENMVLEVKAVDLHYTDEQIEQFKLFDLVPVHSTPHGLNRNFPLSKMTINLNNPSANTITLGTTVKTSLTSKVSEMQSAFKKAVETIPVPSSIVQQAVSEATALITAATHGHVVTTAEEQLIMDTNDKNTAKRVWRWNLNGFGYSSTGYNGTYKSAITMDGWIVGERIAANSISGDKLDITYKTSVTKEIADAEEAARSDSQDYTDGKLKNYYTKSQVETSIKTLETSVLLSAKETAEQYVDGKLKNYSTSAQIKVKTDSIESEVKKKLNSSDLATKIQQNATAVKIAWNNISKYISFESGQLRIYESTNQSNDTLLMKMTYSGAWYYYKGITVGKIGTAGWNNDEDFRGLMFGLNYGADYMTWGYQEKEGGNYLVNLTYYANEKHTNKGLHVTAPMYVFGNLRFNTDAGVYNYGSSDGIRLWADGGVSLGASDKSCCEFTGDSFSIWNNKTIDFWSTLNLHGWGYTNDSDARMKRNIEETAVDGLGVVNGIDLKSFDWVQSGDHETIGIIAQQLLEIAPELVETCSDGHLQLKADKLVYYCIKAIQEMCAALNMGYQVPVWSDPYTLLDKKTFCAKLESGKAKEATPYYEPPITLPNRKRG